MKSYQFICWLVFVVAYFLRVISPGMAAFAALICGVLRKGGYPKFSKDYLKSVAFDENF